MKYLPFLGISLKSSDFIEFIEINDLEVTYNFDKINEGTPDEYWCKSKELGVSFKFNQHQVLEVVFIYLGGQEGFSVANTENSDISLFSSKPEIRKHAQENGINFKEGNADFLGVNHDWIKLLNQNQSVHYQFNDGSLTRVTLTTPNS